MRKPKNLPAWVWDEYVRHMEPILRLDELPDWSPDAGDGPISRILNDEDCNIVWNAIARRVSGSTLLPDASGSPNHVGALMSAVRVGAYGPLPHEGATETARKRGSKIADYAEGLAEELKTLHQADPRGLPMEILDSLATFVEALQRYDARSNKSRPDASWYQERVHEAVETAPKALRAIARGARRWAEGKPIVRRAEGSTNPKLLYFIRHISAYFRWSYGTPLHDSTAALARAVFKSEISGTTVAKLT